MRLLSKARGRFFFFTLFRNNGTKEPKKPKVVCTATKLLRKQWFAIGHEDGRHTSFHGRLKCRLTVAENIFMRANEVEFDERCCRF